MRQNFIHTPIDSSKYSLFLFKADDLFIQNKTCFGSFIAALKCNIPIINSSKKYITFGIS